MLWTAAGFDDYGEPTRATSPVEIKVRWLIGLKEAVDPNGNVIALESQAVVDRVIKAGSILWLGALADWYGTGSGGDDTELMRVAIYDETPDLKGRGKHRVVGLQRYRDSLPGTC